MSEHIARSIARILIDIPFGVLCLWVWQEWGGLGALDIPKLSFRQMIGVVSMIVVISP